MTTAVRSPVTYYAEDVVAGRIVAGRLVRLACERHMRDLVSGETRGIYFDEDAAQWAIDFFPNLLRHSKGEWAGRPLELAPWQAFIIGSLFGWRRRSDDTRRYRLSYSEVPRKNGKSTLAAGVGILLAFFDDEPGAEVYAAATKRDQAKIVWGEARQMVLSSPNIRRRVRVLTANLHDAHTASKFEPLGADADSMDGLNIHGDIIDELHAHKTRAMWDVIETATGARRQPLSFVITTAGSDKASVCYEQHEYAIKVLEEVIEDDTLFAYIATIDEGDDPYDPTSWAKANPNLGISVKLDDLERKSKKAQEVAGEQNAFLRLHLDVWTQSVSRWLTAEMWEKGGSKVSGRSLNGQTCFGGVHILEDMASIVLWFPHPDGGGDVRTWFFIPEDLVQAMEEQDGVPYSAWQRDGYVETTAGNIVDHQAVHEKLSELDELYDLQELAIHKSNSLQLQTDLITEGFTVASVSSTMATMAAPCEELERLLKLGTVRHLGNPVLRWMASNVSVRTDSEGHKRPDQEASGARIGGMRALLMALGRAIVNAEEPEKELQIFLGGGDF
jgi:phage terminase large subunit-like protein